MSFFKSMLVAAYAVRPSAAKAVLGLVPSCCGLTSLLLTAGCCLHEKRGQAAFDLCTFVLDLFCGAKIKECLV